VCTASGPLRAQPELRGPAATSRLRWCCQQAALRAGRAAGRTAEAEDRLRQALAILQRIGAAEAAGVSAERDALPGAPDPASASL
jgi:hypothetical protein